MQTVKPDQIILWLAPDQFPNGETDLPDSLKILCEFGLDIQWCDDIRSYKKLIPTVERYPSAVIITVDDDMYYHRRMVEKLYDAYQRNANCIHCHRATKICFAGENVITIPGGYDTYSNPSYLHKLTGCGGVLYPPGSLYKDICDRNLFMRLAPTNDDIWFWAMSALNGYKCNVVNGYPALYFVKDSQTTSLSSVNDRGTRLFDEQLDNIFRHYKGFKQILLEEWNRRND